MRVSVMAGMLFLGVAQTAATAAQECSPSMRAKLVAIDGQENDRFGSAVSISGNTAIAGAWRDDNENGLSAGAAYIFRFDGANWIEEEKLVASDGEAGHRFGGAVSISGDTALVGSVFDDDNGIRSGAAYIFRFNGSTWVEEAKLLPADGATNDRFGLSVAITGDAAVIGKTESLSGGFNAGAAYVFRFDGVSWVQEAKLVPADLADGNYFGWSVSVSNDNAVIGAFGNDDSGSESGAAYVFRFNGNTWVQDAKLLPIDGATGDRFGFSVSVSDDTALIGAYQDDDNGNDSGSAYVYRFDGANWTEEAKLLPADGAEGDEFGWSTSVSGDSALIGAYLDNDYGNDSGSTYIFRFDGANWAEEDKLLPTDGAEGDEFGWSSSVSGETAVIGSHLHNSNGLNSGSIYIFELNCTADCLPDINDDGFLSPADFSAWIAAFNAIAPECDQNGDNLCSPDDFTAWIWNFNAGC